MLKRWDEVRPGEYIYTGTPQDEYELVISIQNGEITHYSKRWDRTQTSYCTQYALINTREDIRG